MTTVKSAARAAEILDLLGRGEQPPRTASEIADAIGLPRSSAHGLLGTLVDRGYLERTTDAGWKCYSLCAWLRWADWEARA